MDQNLRLLEIKKTGIIISGIFAVSILFFKSTTIGYVGDIL